MGSLIIKKWAHISRFFRKFRKDQMASHKFEEALEVVSHVCISSKFLFSQRVPISNVSVFKYFFMARLRVFPLQRPCYKDSERFEDFKQFSDAEKSSDFFCL